MTRTRREHAVAAMVSSTPSRRWRRDSARAWGRGRSRRARTNGTQSTRAKAAAIAPAPAATAHRRRCAAGRRTTPCSACTCRPTPARRGRVADAARRQREETYQFHRALITCEPAAARHGLERHGLAAFALCYFCLLYLDHCCGHRVWDRRAEPRGSGAASSPTLSYASPRSMGSQTELRQSTICMQ